MKKSAELPFICVRDMVFFPKMASGLFVGRPATIAAIELARQSYDGKILVLTQKRFRWKCPNA
jgi:ATP-dependent Lon protease